MASTPEAIMSLPWITGPTLIWRLDDARHAATWDSGFGAEKVGGRWNSKGVAAVYCALDPATAILEVAVHKGFDAIDSVAHVLSVATLHNPTLLHVVAKNTLPNTAWLHNGPPSHAQQAYGNLLLATHGAIVIPSVVCPYSWNLIFSPAAFKQHYALHTQTAFCLDTRLNPP